ncbi:hypothetical protein MLD52_03460 [Puniceicoccaceae bacterium K14]|nr:hypothetical protein [Puniceicoccaceae bacterium K14]
MILKRIAVTNWRSLLGAVELGPFSDGLNVIHAPNGTGKSSLFEAMRRGLFDVHHVKGNEIESVRPWGRDLTPSVVIEFAEGSETYRVEKTFLSGASSKLSRLEDGKFQPIADSRNADTKIREILAAEAPGRGLSKQEHWGLAQVLWAPQGELAIDKISGSANERLRAALGIQMSGESGGQIEEQIEARFLEYFTSKGGYKKGKFAAPIVNLQEREVEIRSQLLELRQKHQAFEEAAHSVDDARHRRLQARREADATRETVDEMRASVERFDKLKSEQSNKRETESLAKKRYDDFNNSFLQIKTLREQIASNEKTAAILQDSEAGLEKETKSARERLDKKRSERESARNKRSSISEAQKAIDRARAYLDQQALVDAHNKRINKLDAIQKELEVFKQKRTRCVAPESKVLKKLRNLAAKRDAAKAALSASQIHLSISPENSIAVEDLTDSSKHSVGPEETASFSGDALVEIHVNGFGAIRASGPEGSAEKHRKTLEEALGEIEKLCQPFGTDDLERLQTLRDEADAIERSIEALEERMDTLLDRESIETLKQEHAEAKARIAEIEKQYGDWKKEAPVLSKLQKDFESLSLKINDTIAESEGAYEQAQISLSASEKNLNEGQAELKVQQAGLDTAKKRIEELLDGGLSDEAREKAISDALMSWQAAKAAADQAEASLKEIPGDPHRDLKKLEKQRTALEQTEASARDAEKTAEGQLQSLSAEGTYSKLIAAEEELVELENRIAQESIRMDALKLLHGTVSECRSRVIASVSAPVERSASRMLSRVVGPRLGELKLTGEFVPEAITPELSTDPVALSNLSGGELEQLFLIARLALADVLAKDQRQLVVLDDVLNATDSGRLARLLSLLEEVSDRLQVIILTCHPERYRGLEQATFVKLGI